MSTRVIHSEVEEGENFGTAALLSDPLGVALQISDITSWDVRIYDQSRRDSVRHQDTVYQNLGVTPATNNTNTTPGSAGIFSNIIRNDGYWQGQPPGYNFLHIITSTVWEAYSPAFDPRGGHTYRVEYKFTTTWNVLCIKHYVRVTPTAA